MNMDDLEFDWEWNHFSKPEPPFVRDPDTKNAVVYIMDWNKKTRLRIYRLTNEEFTDAEQAELVQLGVMLCNARYPG